MIKIWLQAFRVRTLPLALAGTLLGSFLAWSKGFFILPVFIFSITTSLFLQILSNLANDYGDSVKGTDNEKRAGPERVTASGKVTKKGMKRMIVSLVFLSFISGTLLIFFGTTDKSYITRIIFFILGILAIIAALKYTLGKNPYGYIGFGDLFVFIFFGLISVAGTFYLHSKVLSYRIFLPSSAMGLLSAGVLNLNNLRDEKNDAVSGKRTLVVMIGSKMAKVYHVSLVLIAVILSIIYIVINYTSILQFLFLLVLPLLFANIKSVFKNSKPESLNKQFIFFDVWNRTNYLIDAKSQVYKTYS